MVLDEGKVLYYGPTTISALSKHVAGYSAMTEEVSEPAPNSVPALLKESTRPDAKKRHSLQLAQKNAMKPPTVE